MATKIEDIVRVMESIAPVGLKESYDNVGLMVGDRKGVVNKILIALDCTVDVIEEARAIGAELILTHHPLLFRKPKTITADTLQGRKIISLIKNDIGLYSSHTNWDSAYGGLNDTFVQLLGFNSGEIIDKNINCDKAGVGRIVDLQEEKTLGDLIDIVKEKLDLRTLRFSGDLNKVVKRISVVNGSGEDYLEDSYNMGADLVITGDTRYHFVSDYDEMGLAIIDVGHFNSEWAVMVELSKVVREAIKDMNVEVVISKVVKDPYCFG